MPRQPTTSEKHMARARKNDTSAEPAEEIRQSRIPDDMPSPSDRSPEEEEIRRRAYELYLQRGSEGDDLSDWLRAEDEYRGGSARPSQSPQADEPRLEA